MDIICEVGNKIMSGDELIEVGGKEIACCSTCRIDPSK
jgi:hypothetical protein